MCGPFTDILTNARNVLQEMGLKKAWGSPNGAMRRGWKGITISRSVNYCIGLNDIDTFMSGMLLMHASKLRSRVRHA